MSFMLGLPRSSLRELIRSQHAESMRQHEDAMRYQERREEEFRASHEAHMAEIRARDEAHKAEIASRLAETHAQIEEIRTERKELQARNAEFQAYVEESRAARAKSDRLFEEMREFNREILLRNEKVYKSVLVELEEGRKQLRANTRAVLSVLDRFNGPDGLAA